RRGASVRPGAGHASRLTGRGWARGRGGGGGGGRGPRQTPAPAAAAAHLARRIRERTADAHSVTAG
ncbi:hypothetical protein ACE14D_20315, partial [Streptomyces sp. Act-28]